MTVAETIRESPQEHGWSCTRPGEGTRGTWAMGSLFERLVSAAATGGTLGVALVTQPPGIATPLHRHTQ